MSILIPSPDFHLKKWIFAIFAFSTIITLFGVPKGGLMTPLLLIMIFFIVSFSIYFWDFPKSLVISTPIFWFSLGELDFCHFCPFHHFILFGEPHGWPHDSSPIIMISIIVCISIYFRDLPKSFVISTPISLFSLEKIDFCHFCHVFHFHPFDELNGWLHQP